MKDELLT